MKCHLTEDGTGESATWIGKLRGDGEVVLTCEIHDLRDDSARAPCGGEIVDLPAILQAFEAAHREDQRAARGRGEQHRAVTSRVFGGAL